MLESSISFEKHKYFFSGRFCDCSQERCNCRIWSVLSISAEGIKLIYCLYIYYIYLLYCIIIQGGELTRLMADVAQENEDEVLILYL